MGRLMDLFPQMSKFYGQFISYLCKLNTSQNLNSCISDFRFNSIYESLFLNLFIKIVFICNFTRKYFVLFISYSLCFALQSYFLVSPLIYITYHYIFIILFEQTKQFLMIDNDLVVKNRHDPSNCIQNTSLYLTQYIINKINIPVVTLLFDESKTEGNIIKLYKYVYSCS